ncbi:MAG: endonuclease/exonuclease/phosphatase family protein [Pseudomonadota bacterium]
MRLATYNVEWFDSLFSRDDRLLQDNEWSSRFNVTRQAQADALGHVFSAMDADAVLVIEAPDTSSKRSTVRALERFARVYGLRAREAIIGFANDTQQEIAVLYDPDALRLQHAPRAGHATVPRFDGVFSIDLDVDARGDHVRFSKPPIELACVTSSGFSFHLIGVHLKSKAPYGASDPEDLKSIAISNRRKQLAQAIWLRARVDQVLADKIPLIVAGDFNDGPGLDAFEHLFGRSSVEIVLGAASQTNLYDPHATECKKDPSVPDPATARFWIEEKKGVLHALLDYVMVSPELKNKNPVWRIWHPENDPICRQDPVLRQALLTASDHFPVSIDLPV